MDLDRVVCPGLARFFRGPDGMHWGRVFAYTLWWVWLCHPKRHRAEIDRLFRRRPRAYLQGRWNEAQERHERILTMDETDADALMQLGSMFVRTEQPVPARRAFRQCLELEGGAKWRWEIDRRGRAGRRTGAGAEAGWRRGDDRLPALLRIRARSVVNGSVAWAVESEPVASGQGREDRGTLAFRPGERSNETGLRKQVRYRSRDRGDWVDEDRDGPVKPSESTACMNASPTVPAR